MDDFLLTDRQKEGLFTVLMMLSVEAQKEGHPLPDDGPVESWLTDLEKQVGMDGKMFRAHGRRFVLEDMTEHEHAVFHALMEKGWIAP